MAITDFYDQKWNRKKIKDSRIFWRKWPESSILIFERNAENGEKGEKSETILDFQRIGQIICISKLLHLLILFTMELMLKK